jgi:hypothetical protein
VAIDNGDRRDARGRRWTPATQRAKLVRACHHSGLTQAQFTAREGLRYSTFAHWVQKALKAAARSGGQEHAVQFAQVQLPNSPSLHTASLEVRLPDGTVIRGEQADEIAKLLKALRR